MMKWWGWGDKDFTFPMADKPQLWPWIMKKVGLPDAVTTPAVERKRITLPKARMDSGFCADIEKVLKGDQILLDDEERLLHCFGKSYPDLIRVRRGEIKRAPDMVLLPDSHEQVEAIVRSAHGHTVCLIPFGGGTNIVGGVEPLDRQNRMVVTLDMRRMNRVLSVDKYSNTAVIQAGALGPKLEADLATQGYTLGHHPDSFEYSTLGGWLATRSAGMQSDAYGKIEDMVVAVKLVTPSGTISTRPMPASSAGPDLNQLVVGSEGVLGVITEATMRVHPVPAMKDYRGYLFPDFAGAVAAIHECIERGELPSMIRLQDEGETELAFNMKAHATGLAAIIQKPVKSYLAAKGFTTPCIMVVGFEGEPRHVKARRSEVFRILKAHRGFPLGKGIGKTWSKDKYNTPYLRDYVMDHACMVDVSETAALWKDVVSLHKAVTQAISARFKSEFGGGYVGCHISHTYQTGACLYFTYAGKQIPGDEIKQYYEYKNLVTQTIVANGGTLSHHHAVGYDHLPWMEKEVSPTGVQALRALKDSLDPRGIFNPGKLIPTAENLAERARLSGTNPQV